jgi:hypothetical protein
MPKLRGKRRIAPRLVGGARREHMTGGLPPPVRDWIRMMAQEAGESQSFWMEKQILEHVYPARMGRAVRYVAPSKQQGKG